MRQSRGGNLPRSVYVGFVLVAGFLCLYLLALGVSRVTQSTGSDTSISVDDAGGEAVDVSDEQLVALVAIAEEIDQIQYETTELVRRAGPDQAAVGAIEQSAKERMVEAVRRHGLTPAEYSILLRVVQSDEDLYLRLVRLQQDSSEGE